MNILKIFILFIIFINHYITIADANNLSIANATLEDRDASAGTAVVQFNISWDHSWRENDGRRDAVWVFCKLYKNTTAPWLHAKLKTAGTNPVDTYSGSNGDAEIVVPSDKIGAFIQRRSTGKGAFSSSRVRLTLDLSGIGVSSSDTIQVKVYGIEMVYVPTGPFYVGDGDGQNESQYAFHQNGVDNTAVQITTAAVTVAVDSNASDDIDTSPVSVDGDGGITGNSSWPTGFTAYYIMKYELAQVQYVDFLNSLTREQQQTRVASTITGTTITNYYVMTGGLSGSQRQSIRAPSTGNGTTPTTVVFGMDFTANATFNETGDGAMLGMNFANYMDMAAYADWAGLRPMTELEFERRPGGRTLLFMGSMLGAVQKSLRRKGRS